MDLLDTLGERLRWALARANMSQNSLGKAVGVSRNAVGQWCSDTTTPTEENLALAAETLGVSLPWLRDKIGELPRPLNEPQIESSVDAELGRARPRGVREIDIRMGMGAKGFAIEAFINEGMGETYSGENVLAEWDIPADYLRNELRASAKDLRIFPVVGDSMEPRLFEGDRVFLDLRYRVPAPEGIFGLWDGNAFVVKRLQIIRGRSPTAVRIIPENPRYPTEEATMDEIVVVGRLAGRFTTR